MRGCWPLLLAALLAGCDTIDLARAVRYEETQKHLPAIKHYERFIGRHPEHPRAAEALVRAADIYSRSLNRCLEARRHYEAALRKSPSAEPWASRAKAGLLACPDFFPMAAGWRWTYGDTASLGRNMRLELEVKSSSGAVSAEAASTLFAGVKNIRSEALSYAKKDWAVWESGQGRHVPILRFPFTTGHAWTAPVGEDVIEYRIESDSARVQTAAGAFEGCLKVKEFNPRYRGSWKYDYYAPFIGRVKTTVGGPGFENPNTELIEYRTGR
ncbi:MAG: tetratricopeptide repeat protein [Elusimicrobiota bacterium]|jgi:tetratricopeptide (TPR) repeat protein